MNILDTLKETNFIERTILLVVLALLGFISYEWKVSSNIPVELPSDTLYLDTIALEKDTIFVDTTLVDSVQ